MMKILTIITFLLYFVVLEALVLRDPKKPFSEALNGYKTYAGYSVIRVIPQTDDQIRTVIEMEKHLNFEPDFWKPPRALGKSIDIMVSPDKRAEATIYLKKAGMVPITKIADVGKLVSADKMEIESYKPNANLATDPDTFDFYKYHPFADIMSYIEAVARKYSSFVSIASLGKSLEGRDTKYLKIGYPSTSKKNALFIDAGIHAREWIAPATALYTINQLVTNLSFTDLLKAIDIYIAPAVNPDGYEYTRSTDRLWRKTRSGPRQGCYGVDINRNFPFKWMFSGASSNPCSNNYAGPSATSEIETKNLANFIVSHNDTIKVYLTLHSYSEQIVYPWAYQNHTYPPDVADLKALGQEMYYAILAVHGTKYLVGNSADAESPAGGQSDDYAKSVGIKYDYDVQLRPGDDDNNGDSMYGFELPPKFIQPAAEEVFPGFIAAAKRVKNGPF